MKRIENLKLHRACQLMALCFLILTRPESALSKTSGPTPTPTGAVSTQGLGIMNFLRAFFDAHLLGDQVQAEHSASTEALTGQSSTRLPDGRLLRVGGLQKDEAVSTAFVDDPRTGRTTPLRVGPHFARYCHTATVLPNGTVLIFGGIGSDGAVVQASELFDPSTNMFTTIATLGLAPRAFHTATLLTDGRMLVAGGISSSGQVLGAIDYWDYRTGSDARASAGLQLPRGAHTARLQPDGTVLIWGGVGANGTPLNAGEVIDPQTQVVSARRELPLSTNDGMPTLAASIPEDGELNVPLNSLIAVRFSKPLQVQTINGKNISLKGPSGAISAKVVAAEDGRLAFITPSSALAPASEYTLTIFDAVDSTGAPLPDTVIRFTTVNGGALGALPVVPLPGRPDPFNSPARQLPPLHAPKGVTAVSGQVLQLSGDPLPNVTLQIGSTSVRTDKTGRFLIEHVPSGHQVMWIDGTTANGQNMSYGLYEDGVLVTAGQTNVLNYTIWMTILDTADEVSIPSPTDRETIVSTPLLPGLELHLPAGTVIQDRNGNPVTKVGITLIPVSQPPFPLPAGVNVPTYFTIQPGGATLEGYWGGSYWSVGARLFYPNAEKLPPGTPFNFWNYDATAKGWYVYGQGRVTADAKEVVPNSGVEIYGFSGAMVGNPPNPPTGPNSGNPDGGDPVDLQTGLFVYKRTDLALSDVIPINLTRTYRQMDPTSHAFGIGTMSNYDVYLIGDGSTYSYIDLVLANGGKLEFDRTSTGTGYSNAVYLSTSSPGQFYGAQIVWNGSSWTLTMKNGTKLLFPESSNAGTDLQAALAGIVDRYGNTVTLTRDSNNNLTSAISPNGRWIQYSYDTSNRVTQASDSSGRTVYYTYDSSGRLYTAQDANGGITTFTYDSNNNMQTIKDARGIVYLTNYYDNNDMISKQVLADGSQYTFSYVLNAGAVNGNGAVLPSLTNSQATVTDPRGNVHVATFNADGYDSSDTYGVGKPEQQLFTYNRQPGSGLLLSMTDALNRTTAFTYDGMGNVTSVNALYGTPNATTTSFGYNGFGELTSVTDALSRTTSFAYDSSGSLVSLTGTDGNSSTFTHNANGQIVSFTDAMNNTTQLSYSGPDLSGITDPLSRALTIFTDEAGRIAEVADPLGNSVQEAYSPLNQVTSTTDPLGGITSMSYDPNGNFTSLTDPKNTQNPTKFMYDNMDRLETRTDPLTNSEGYQYDGDGNLVQFTDRNGNITSYQYDALNRLTFAGFGTQPGPTYQNTISYTWDGGNRLTQVADSIAGTTTLGYDGLSRLTSVSSPQGSVSYTYDPIGRRQTMTVAGQPEVEYTYNAGNRVTKIAQGSSVVQIGYDADERRTSLTLPNGIVANYSYDAASELTGITYQGAAMELADLEYTYDQAGRRATVGGSLAHTNIPQPLSTASYNADNQLTRWGTTAMTYDLDGNLTNDGVHAYTWDSRGQLAAVDNGTSASFGYDPFGRRIGKTVYGITTGYLYDGANIIQELSGGNPSANLLSGGLDEVFARTDSNGISNFLRDGIGSTAELTDSTGNVLQTYTYDPYGFTSTSGGSTANSYEYIGREMDATGLYNLRARYYNPTIGRFISEDPMGLAAGLNEYAYVGDSPTNFVDPSGLDKKNPFECASNAASKVSLASGLKALGIGSIPGGGFVADALGGNVFSGATDLITSLGTGKSGEGDDAHSVFYNMGQSVVAGPTQGFGMVAEKIANGFGSTLEDTPWSSSAADIATNTILKGVNGVINSGSEVTTLFGEASTAGFSAAEYVSGFGEAKFAYDFFTYAGSFAGCEVGLL